MSTKKAGGSRPAKYSARVSEAAWRAQLPTIKYLYLTLGLQLKGEGGVIEQMERLHGFYANEGQYYTMFKKHKIAKNKKRHLQGEIADDRITYDEDIIPALSHRRRPHINSDRPQFAESSQSIPLDVEEAMAVTAWLPMESEDQAIRSVAVDRIGVIDNGSEFQNDLSSQMDYLIWPMQEGHTNSPDILSLVTATTSNAFHWHEHLNWKDVTRYLTSQQGSTFMGRQVSSSKHSSDVVLVKELWKRTQFLFWHSPPPHVSSLPTAAELMSKFLLSTLVNNINEAQHMDLSHRHKWITSIPSHIMDQFFRKLLAAEMPIFRDMLFSAAICNGNKAIVETILKQKPDLGTQLAMWMPSGFFQTPSGFFQTPSGFFQTPSGFFQTPSGFFQTPSGFFQAMRPVAAALHHEHFEIAQTLVEQQCVNTRSEILVMIINDIVSTYRGTLWGRYRSVGDLLHLERDANVYRELLELPLQTLEVTKKSFELIQFDPLWFHLARSDESLTRRLLNMQKGHIKALLDQRYFDSMIRACEVSSSKTFVSTAGIILNWVLQEIVESDCAEQLEFKQFLGYIEEECYDVDWLMDMVEDFRTRLAISQPDVRPSLSLLSDDKLEQIKEAIACGDACGVADLLAAIKADDAAIETYRNCYVSEGKERKIFMELIAHAVISCQDQIAFDLVLTRKAIATSCMVIFMMHNRPRAMLKLLCMDKSWETAWLRAHNERDYHDLEQLFIQDSTSFLLDHGFDNIIFTAVTHIAIDMEDGNILQLISDSGRLYERSERHFRTYRDIAGSLGEGISFPSLLSVAAGKNNIPMLQSLVSHGLDARHWKVLKDAIRFGASITTMKAILDLAANVNSPYSFIGYGASGIIEAIRQRKYDVLRFILPRTDVNSIERENKITPLVHAIISQEFESVEILLDNGADPTKLVKSPNIKGQDYTFPPSRSTPILIAIGVGNMDIIKLLVGKGASVNQTTQYCLRRSPLQRAAEVGNFEVVQYLLDNKAKVDFNNIRDSGTALQFAAIKGYVGIANLLLDHGADVNAMPARGRGRTALEGAAEWGRLDMVLLLFKHGVDFDLEVGDDHEPQAKRAQRFARKNGHGSLAQYIAHLWESKKAESRMVETPTRCAAEWWMDNMLNFSD